MHNKIFSLLLLSMTFQFAHADGVSLGSTRLIYPDNQNQITAKIFNTDKKGNYLVQSWVSDKDGKKVNDFIVTPPLFVLKANTDSVLRIVYTGNKADLPKDKEKLFFFNAKVIPSLDEEQRKQQNYLLIATTTNIKLFMRPANLQEGSMNAYKNIKCSYANSQIKVENPTPYYMNLVSLIVNGKEVSEAETIAPQSSVYIKTTAKSDQLKFNVINDYGVQFKDEVCRL